MKDDDEKRPVFFESRFPTNHSVSCTRLTEMCHRFVVFPEVSDMREDDLINISNAARQQAKPMLEPFEDKCKKKKVPLQNGISITSRQKKY